MGGRSCRSSARRNIIFFFNDTATAEVYTLSLHDALPMYSHTPETSVGSPFGSKSGGGSVTLLSILAEEVRFKVNEEYLNTSQRASLIDSDGLSSDYG